MGNINVNILFRGSEQTKDLDTTNAYSMKLNLSFYPGEIDFEVVHDINSL